MNYQPSYTQLTSADAAMILTTSANNSVGVVAKQPPDHPIQLGVAMDEAIWESLKTQIQAQLRNVIVDPVIWERLMSNVHGQLLAIPPDECYYMASELNNLARSTMGRRYSEVEPFTTTNRISEPPRFGNAKSISTSPMKSSPGIIHQEGAHYTGSSPIFSPPTFGNHSMAFSSTRDAVVPETMASRPAGSLEYPSANQLYTLFDSPDKHLSSDYIKSSSSTGAVLASTTVAHQKQEDTLIFGSPDVPFTFGNSPILTPLSFGNHGTPSPWKSAVLASATMVTKLTQNVDYPSKKLGTLFGSLEELTSSSDKFEPFSPDSFAIMPTTVVSETSSSLEDTPVQHDTPLSCNSKSSSKSFKVFTTKNSKKSKSTEAKKLRGKILVVKKPSTGALLPSELDVLAGRGGQTNRHPGNMKFRNEARKFRDAYQRAYRDDKKKVLLVQELLDRVKAYGGRFLEKGHDGCWYEMKTGAARKKSTQALRENKWTK